MNQLLQQVKDAGFPYWREVIHLFIGGSELHGAKVPDGSDDTDIYGIFMEPPEKKIGIDAYEHFVWSTASSSRKNMAGDTDITLYSLGKWATLACKGNPSVLHFIFAKNLLETPKGYRDTWFHSVLAQRQIYLAASHASSFIGYAYAQFLRFTGERNRNVNRPELVEKYGYDTKYAMHIIRVLSEGIELMKTGTITLPNPRKNELVAIRTGEWTSDRVIEESKKLLDEMAVLKETSVLQPKINRDAVSQVIAENYRRYWDDRYKL